MTSTNVSAKLSAIKFRWSNNELIISYIDNNGLNKTINIADHLELTDIINSTVISTMEDMRIACAYAIVLAAKELNPFDEKYYSKLLKISLNIKTSNKHILSSTVRRMLSAGDDANGPVNGTDRIVQSMILEANRIHNEKFI